MWLTTYVGLVAEEKNFNLNTYPSYVVWTKFPPNLDLIFIPSGLIYSHLVNILKLNPGHQLIRVWPPLTNPNCFSSFMDKKRRNVSASNISSLLIKLWSSGGNDARSRAAIHYIMDFNCTQNQNVSSLRPHKSKRTLLLRITLHAYFCLRGCGRGPNFNVWPQLLFVLLTAPENTSDFVRYCAHFMWTA